MSPRFVLGRENVPCFAEVVNRSLRADCTDFTFIGNLAVVSNYLSNSELLSEKLSKDSTLRNLEKTGKSLRLSGFPALMFPSVTHDLSSMCSSSGIQTAFNAISKACFLEHTGRRHLIFFTDLTDCFPLTRMQMPFYFQRHSRLIIIACHEICLITQADGQGFTFNIWGNLIKV